MRNWADDDPAPSLGSSDTDAMGREYKISSTFAKVDGFGTPTANALRGYGGNEHSYTELESISCELGN